MQVPPGPPAVGRFPFPSGPEAPPVFLEGANWKARAMPTEAMMFSPSAMSFREVVSRGIGPERFEKQWRGHVTGGHLGEWPRMHSQWFPPAWALRPENIQLKPLPYQWPLTIELVPQDTWGRNARSAVSRREWDLIRRATYRRAGHMCEICGGAGEDHPVEAHEIWHYDDLHKTQTLEGLQALCPACHQVKHFGKASADGRAEEVAAHLADVNGWGPLHAELYVKQQFARWKHRSQFAWTVDMGPLESDAYRAWLRRAKQRAEPPVSQQSASGQSAAV